MKRLTMSSSFAPRESSGKPDLHSACRRFDDTALLEVLNTPDNLPATGSAQLNVALDDFITVIHSFCREEMNIAERTRAISDLRSKLAAYLEDKKYSSKRYSLLRIIIKRALSSIDSELSLIKMDLEYPDRFIEFPADPQPLARWGGQVVDLIEHNLAPQAAGLLQHPSGKPMNYEESIELLEKIYGIKISNPSDRRGKALDRQKNTVFQDEMRRVYLEEAKKRNQ